MFCSQCGCLLFLQAKFCHLCGHTTSGDISNSAACPIKNINKNQGTNVPSNACDSFDSNLTISTASTTTVGQSCTPVSFKEYRKRKEQERSSRFRPKAKRAKHNETKDRTPSEVNINVGLRRFREDDLKFVRGSTLPLIVAPTIGAKELLEKASEKIVKFNSEVSGEPFGFTLLYPDRTRVCNLPGSSEPFTLERYKKEIGKQYSRLTFHVCRTDEYLKFLCKPSYCSEVNSDSDLNIVDEVIIHHQIIVIM